MMGEISRGGQEGRPAILVAAVAGYGMGAREYGIETRVVVPVHGRVVAPVVDADTVGHSGRFVLLLVPPAGERAGALSARRDSATGLRIGIEAVHPGTYQASLRYVPSEDERNAGREECESKPVPVVIRAGEETEVQLRLPAGGG